MNEGPAVIHFRFEGRTLKAPTGLTIAGGLLWNGISSWRTTRVTNAPRGIFCGIGTCFDCLVDVNEYVAVRACITMLNENDEVRASCSTGGPRHG